MRGEFIGVWSETWREIWQPLIDLRLGEKGEVVPEDIFCDLYRELAEALKEPLTPGALADIIDDPVLSREKFEMTGANELAGERALVSFFEAVHSALEELVGDELSNFYFNLLASFIEKFSLRYDLRRPCALCPTLPGLLTNLVQQMRVTSQADAHLAKLNHEFEEALRDLRHDRTETRIKSYLTKQFILVEGIANACNGTTGETLGQRCNQASWPHPTLKAAAGNLYGFRSDYPGLGHAGSPKAVLRDLDDRELVGVSCMLLGVLPYVDSSINLNQMYGDSPPLSGTERTAHAASSTRPSTSSHLNRFASWVARLLTRD
jgi:hypothetical protein